MDRLAIFAGRATARAISRRPSPSPRRRPFAGTRLFPQPEGTCHGAAEPNPGRLGRRRLPGRVRPGNEDEAAAAAVETGPANCGAGRRRVVVVDGRRVNGGLRRRCRLSRVVTVVDSDAVRDALSNAEPVTTALQPLTAIRPFVTTSALTRCTTCTHLLRPGSKGKGKGRFLI